MKTTAHAMMNAIQELLQRKENNGSGKAKDMLTSMFLQGVQLIVEMSQQGMAITPREGILIDLGWMDKTDDMRISSMEYVEIYKG